MHIYIDNHIFQLQKYGGISRYFSTFLKHSYKNKFISKNINISLHNPIHCNQYISDLSLGYKLPLNKITNKLGSLFFHISNELINSNSILFISYYGRNLRRVKAKGMKLISTAHDMIPEEGFNDAEKYIIPQKKNTFYFSDIIISVSETSAKKLIYRYPDLKDRVRIIKNFSYLPLIEEEYAYSINLKNKDYLLAFSGLAKYKNLELLIRSFKYSSLPKTGVGLIIIGCGPNDINDFSKNFAKEGCNIKFISPKDIHLKSLYKKALAICSLSSMEGFSIPIIEALHFNKKLILSDIEIHREIGGEFSNFVDINHLESIVDKFNKLSDLKKPEDLLGKISYKEYIKYYSPNRFINEYIKLFKNL